jgi:hypothetical protein
MGFGAALRAAISSVSISNAYSAELTPRYQSCYLPTLLLSSARHGRIWSARPSSWSPGRKLFGWIALSFCLRAPFIEILELI